MGRAVETFFPESDFRARISRDWPATLQRVVERARALAGRAVVVFDLDSTLFDNRPRQARIVREFGAHQRVPGLARCEAGHFTSGWDLEGAIARCGVELDGWLPALRAFWVERFFTSAYCVDDVPIKGAPAFVTSLSRAGAIIAYATGRHEEMRAGTVEAMTRHGFPVPGEGVSLLMKRTFEESDDSFKRSVHDRLHALGEVIAVFDNEPAHVNDYARSFPHASVIHLATDHSGRPIEIAREIASVPHFAIDGDPA